MRPSGFIDVMDKVRASVYSSRNIQSSFRRAGIHPLNKRRILDDSSIQWQTRNPRHLKTNVELRDVPYRQPEPTQAEKLAAAANAISVTESDSAAAIALDLLKQTTNYALRLEEDFDILRQEIVQLHATKAAKAADRRVVTRVRTGTSIGELRKARDNRLQRDAAKAVRQGIRQRQRRGGSVSGGRGRGGMNRPRDQHTSPPPPIQRRRQPNRQISANRPSYRAPSSGNFLASQH